MEKGAWAGGRGQTAYNPMNSQARSRINGIMPQILPRLLPKEERLGGTCTFVCTT